MLDDGASFLDAFYMTAITVSTIGFHEIIDLDKYPLGRLFTVFLAFSGIGIITYFFSNLATLFIEGEIKRSFERQKMEKKIKALRGHYVICGCGRVGRNIAKELFQTRREFVAADIGDAPIERFEQDFPKSLFLQGDCTEDDMLEKLGVKNAQGVFVTTDDDNVNLVICLSVRQLNPPVKIVALSKDIGHVLKMRKAGANRVITPTYIGGQRMASEMIRPEVTEFLDDMLRSEFNQRLEQITIPSSIEGHTLENLHLDRLKETVLLALSDNNRWIYKPDVDHVLKAGMHLVLMTTPKERLHSGTENEIKKKAETSSQPFLFK